MKAAPPLISFIVPVYNTQDTVLRTLESIAALPQHSEIIVVHDGGSDDSLALVKAFADQAPLDVTVLDQPNRGLSVARMTGVRQARGTFIAFLDSDDFINASVFQRMAKEAVRRSWDVAVCRSAIWDPSRSITEAFYDERIWAELCGSGRTLSTSVSRSPGLLRLEPNANRKIIRREFFVQARIAFPEGLLFEDLPAHFSVLLKAERVGLVNHTGYYYRVSRPGKISEERSARRFDMITIGHRAVDLLLEPEVSRGAAAAGLMMLTRMVFWCGQMAPNSLRRSYFAAAFALFQRLPKPVVAQALRSRFCTAREGLVLMALALGDGRLVAWLLASGRTAPAIMALRYQVMRWSRYR